MTFGGQFCKTISTPFSWCVHLFARPSTDTGPTFLYGDSDTPPNLVAFYDHAGETEMHILDLTPRALTG